MNLDVWVLLVQFSDCFTSKPGVLITENFLQNLMSGSSRVLLLVMQTFYRHNPPIQSTFLWIQLFLRFGTQALFSQVSLEHVGTGVFGRDALFAARCSTLLGGSRFCSITTMIRDAFICLRLCRRI